MLVTQTLTVTPSSAYAAGNLVGGLITLPKTNSRLLQVADAVLLDKSAQNVAYELLFFDTLPVGALTDKAAYVVNVADLPHCLGFVPLVNAMAIYGAGGGVITMGAYAAASLNKRLFGGAGGALWALLITRGTPTFATADALTLKLILEAVKG